MSGLPTSRGAAARAGSPLPDKTQKYDARYDGVGDGSPYFGRESFSLSPFRRRGFVALSGRIRSCGVRAEHLHSDFKLRVLVEGLPMVGQLFPDVGYFRGSVFTAVYGLVDSSAVADDKSILFQGLVSSKTTRNERVGSMPRAERSTRRSVRYGGRSHHHGQFTDLRDEVLLVHVACPLWSQV